jgi:2-iminobutanoate/2-iminopropanoate deaminase
MTIETFRSPELAPPVGPFSQAVLSGDFLYLSGQVGQNPASGQLVAGGVEAQAEQIFSNLQAVLAAAGKSLADVVRVGVFLTDLQDFAAVNAIYARHFSPPFPARTTIAAAALPLGAAIEIDLIAGA